VKSTPGFPIWPRRRSADIPYDDTWDRSGEANRPVFQARIEADLLDRRIPFITLTGSLEDRMQNVSKVLDRFDKYRSLGDNLQFRYKRDA
jgi:hypothetical protein